ncbi:hypothetical protein, partial [Bradyrhizobium sp. Mp27]|uniref:hypothetical protein n=1 Tax=Bradyrhizobium sp. Mp27 TaxID=3042157 RepID=UPI00248BDAED
RLFFVIFAPDSQQESSPLSGRKSTQATVRICGASSDLPSDPAALAEMVLAFEGENDDLRAEIATLKSLIFGA